MTYIESVSRLCKNEPTVSADMGNNRGKERVGGEGEGEEWMRAREGGIGVGLSD